MSPLLASFADLLVDNPIVHKDASLVLRRRRTIAIWLIAAGAVLAVSTFVVVEGSQALRYYGSLDPVGDDLLQTICGIALLAVSLLVPALASSMIAGERQQGTLPLLLVTGLSPLKIVIGKLLAVLVVVAPFVALALPPLGYAVVLLGVDVADVVFCAAGIVAVTVAAASVGVFVSASTSRARAAAPGALLAAVVPAVTCAVPTFAATTTIDGGRDELRPLVLVGLVMASLITLVSVYGAWSALAPRVVPRFPLATRIFAVVVVTIAGVGAAIVSSTDVKDIHFSVVFPGIFLCALTTFVYVTTSACDRRSPSPLLVGGGAMLLVSAAVTALALVSDDVRERLLWSHHTDALVVALLHVAAACGIATLVARFRPQPVLAGFVGGFSVFALVLVPAFASELGVADAFSFLSFSEVDHPQFPLAVAFWATLALGATVLGTRGRVRLA